MHSAYIVAAMVSAAAASSTAAARITGQANIVNNCNSAIYIKSVDSVDPARGDAQAPRALLPGKVFYEEFRAEPTGGVALKVAADPSFAQRTELAYTLKPADDRVWYSLSNIHCRGDECAFRGQGMSLQASRRECASVACAPGKGCPARDVYMNPDDHFAVKSCRADVMLTLLLCSAQQFSNVRVVAAGEGAQVASARNHTARAVYNRL